jgi:hypothetical protein
MSNNEKEGGNPIDYNITNSFRNTIDMCNLNDLGSSGHKYTWHNRQQGDQYIQARLDRFLASTNWIAAFPHYNNSHLLRYQSDHCPIMLEFSNNFLCRQNKGPYHCRKFEQIWLSEKEHYQIVKENWQGNNRHINSKLHQALTKLHAWGSNKFGNIPRRIKETQKDLLNLNPQNSIDNPMQLIKAKEKELDDLLQSEEIWWRQRSRAM